MKTMTLIEVVVALIDQSQYTEEGVQAKVRVYRGMQDAKEHRIVSIYSDDTDIILDISPVSNKVLTPVPMRQKD